MQEKMIDKVNNGYDKRDTYKEFKIRHKKAVAQGFIFEAMLIDYAIMEDHLTSFLYYMGALREKDSSKIDYHKKELREIVLNYSDEEERGLPCIHNITGKIKMIQCATIWSSTVEGIPENSKYLGQLKTQMESLDADGLLSVLGKIRTWLIYRNEIIHGLMNKKLESLYSEISDKEKEGFDLAEELDKFVRVMKKGLK